MKATPVKTHKITPEKDVDIQAILKRYIPKLREGSVVAISSKIISICQGRYVKIDDTNKDQLIRQEAEYYLPRDKNRFFLTIKRNLLIPSAGIDESNGSGYYILWPKDPQQTVNDIRKYLVQKTGLRKLGVILCDSKTTPLRWGVTGVAIAHSGFVALYSYVDKRDVFGRKMKFTKINVMDALAASAVFVMGEGKEQTPLAVIEDIPYMQFQRRNPTQKELQDIRITFGEEDLYKGLLSSAQWQKGGSIS